MANQAPTQFTAAATPPGTNVIPSWPTSGAPVRTTVDQFIAMMGGGGGLPTGGSPGQVLKIGGDGDPTWGTDEVSAGGGITAFPGVAFASDYLVANSTADQAAALDNFFDQARVNGKSLLFDQGPQQTYYTSKCHMFGRVEFADEGGVNRPGISNCIIDFGRCTIKKHSSASLGTQFERRAVLLVSGGSNLVFKNGKISANRDVVTAGQNEFKPAMYIQNGIRNVWFENMIFGESWGDGMEMDGLYDSNSNENNWPQYIWYTNCFFNRAGRNGLTINQGKHIRCINCEFTNTEGHSPEAGVDIESYNDNEVQAETNIRRRDAYDIIFIGCTFANNARPGMILAAIDMTGAGDVEAILEIHDVKIIGCTFRNNGLKNSHHHIVCRGVGVLIDGCQFSDLNTNATTSNPPSNYASPVSCIWFNHFSRELYSDILVRNCQFRNNLRAEAMIVIGRSGSTGVNSEPVIVEGCSMDGSTMLGDFPLIRMDVGKAIIRNCYLKGRGAGSTTAGIDVNGSTYCVISGIDAENLTTIVTNSSGNLRRADQLTRLSGVTSTFSGTAAGSSLGNV